MDKNIRFDGPGQYLVNTKEQIDPGFLEIFNIKIFNPADKKGNKLQNKFIIQVKDQAELSGFLNALYNSRYTLIGIDRLPDHSFEQSNKNN